ncbi:Gfo/Idh/MocA family oxidoreductase [Tenacibaculum finnmarkense genomovar finnmarkense]|uniref:Gfo/Idh/MocA family oxidoreductase n=1 Tax=Tenacibaculum finnmarkense genomovar finnmarkense TaxID=1458503 RepID=A0AAP1WG40_9FLAO|nr:Gfo/Idh/MocA family oxidoreductase [Tenacibaculum finnmarkense]MBE7652750.1 Gfo/Idh/MocA family oxidoreductase [Tenacibaculum finnmarkense genomovar finnmarkense]MBE7660895.1 Gfo/Idh/MocA family oxidoreductase [Tenacibaculum finnmarkense genomovar finnmarkense]MBE7693154.1 Gfo/Idh/MocA family oxidoreductase [Tenacibaculum finnmarkense genomovar finnmarkense]MBE7694973.1 Gfo/Idh/MocA family oxidoreductase [Tenacibaculum finnmarkense genomovar finnmarkense]MCD8403393.1 Gfo/Idh/MocA family oxi
MKNFALIGASGYIAPRHMKAIKETGNNLLVALDPYDGIGIMDRNFPQADFFTEFEKFDSFIDTWHRNNQSKRIDYMSICSPNYLHDAHIRFALKNGADAISEKPVVLNTQSIDQLKIIEQETGQKVYNILQLRLHPSIIALKEKVTKELKENPLKVYDIDLTYLTSRGKWYFASWKGNQEKSGGITFNIGVHFYDMLCWIFGDVQETIVHLKQADANAGSFKLKNANVRWFLSVNYDYIPKDIKASGLTTFRSIIVDGQEIEFSNGFTDLHTRSYEEILKGNGFGLDQAYASISTVTTIINSQAIGLKGAYHPFCKNVING